jgi:hypothetical protein
MKHLSPITPTQSHEMLVRAYRREIHLAVQEREGARRETEFPGVRRMYLERMRFWAKLATMHGWRGPVHSPFQILRDPAHGQAEVRPPHPNRKDRMK